MAHEESVRLGEWVRDHRVEKHLTQGDLAVKLEAGIGFSRSQQWFSQVETAQAAPSKLELVLIAVAIDADPVEALELGGFLTTPAWARRLERKVDEMVVATKTAARTTG